MLSILCIWGCVNAVMAMFVIVVVVVVVVVVATVVVLWLLWLYMHLCVVKVLAHPCSYVRYNVLNSAIF